VSDLPIYPALRDSVNEVLEKMFFLDALEDQSAKENAGAADEIAAQVSFQGDPAGSLALRVTSPAARRIAADFLGSDEEEVSGRQTADVVCELANMICGSLLSRVESATAFHLGPPQIVTPSENRVTGAGPTQYAVELPNGTLTVLVTIGTPTCLHPAQSVS
jgi:CheY-specific phosphatase CheX